MTAIERFFLYLESQGLKHTPIEKELGLSNGYLGKMHKTKSSMGSDVLEKILSHFSSLNAEWLIAGRGDMVKTTDTPNDENNGSLEEERRKLTESVCKMADTADRNSRTMEKIVDMLIKNQEPTSLIGPDKKGDATCENKHTQKGSNRTAG